MYIYIYIYIFIWCEHSSCQNLLFRVPRTARLTRPTREPPSPVGRWLEPPSWTTYLFHLRPESLAHPSCEYPSPVGWRQEPPGHLTLPFCLYLSDTWVPISRRTPARALPARQHYLFKSHAQAMLTRPTQLELCSPRTSARASQPDKLTVSVRPHHNIETPSNATYPVGQAILAFSPPPVRLNHPTREYWSPVGRRESLPAGQPHLFLLRQRR